MHLKLKKGQEKNICQAYLKGKGIRKIKKDYRIGTARIYYILGKNRIPLHGASAPTFLPPLTSRVEKRYMLYVPRHLRDEIKIGSFLKWKKIRRGKYEIKVLKG